MSGEYLQIAGNYPFLAGLPDVIALQSPVPYSFYCGIGEKYPYIVSVPDTIKSSWPVPYSFFAQDDDINDGYPYLPNIGVIVHGSPPVYPSEYITVYDMNASQLEFFESNGLAILMPTSCEITEELNGAYELVLTHPIDSYGKWRYLLELNIIKANSQLFRIYKKQTTLAEDGSKQRIVYARHITYDLNDKLLMDVRPTNQNGHDFLEWIFTHIYDDDPGHKYQFYNFSYDSDIEKTATAYYEKITPIAALIGEDNCFVNRLGGELHRDNFWLSINERKEGSIDHTDAIRYGFDMLEIEEDVDYTDMVSYLWVFTNIGYNWHGSLLTSRIAHPISRAITLNYDTYDIEAARTDAIALFNELCYPKVTYTIRFADLKNVDLYKDFIELQNFNVGDTIPIYCEELDITTIQKVVKKTIRVNADGTTETIEIVLGNIKNALTRTDKRAGLISQGSAAEKLALQAIEDAKQSKVATITTWGSAKIYTWAQLYNIKWEELRR